nr:GNAT family N-acetyltransferase [uncultured Rhodopila sp.]
MQRNITSADARQTGALFAGGNIRRLLAGERGRLRDHLLRLSPADRQFRFLGCVGDDAIKAYTGTLLSPGVTVLGCFVRGVLRAVGELHRQGSGRVAEVAITVEHPFQGRGIGTELLWHLVDIARNRGIRTLHCFCLIDNTRAQKIARKLGGAINTADGAVEAEIVHPWPSCLSLLSEANANGQAVLQAWWLRPLEEAPVEPGPSAVARNF